jgi:hypothetical protein
MASQAIGRAVVFAPDAENVNPLRETIRAVTMRSQAWDLPPNSTVKVSVWRSAGFFMSALYAGAREIVPPYSANRQKKPIYGAFSTVRGRR